MTMRKSEVQLDYHQGNRDRRCPMLNVRVDYPVGRDAWHALAAQVEADSGMAGFAAWCDALPDDGDASQWAFDAACEDGARYAIDLAGEVFGAAFGAHADRDRRVWQTGRSGGWLYVEGLPDVETWDAIQLGKWSRFAKMCDEIVAGIPYDGLTLLAINAYASECQAFADAERLAETVAADAMMAEVHG